MSAVASWVAPIITALGMFVIAPDSFEVTRAGWICFGIGGINYFAGMLVGREMRK